jgi:hypothetical protein
MVVAFAPTWSGVRGQLGQFRFSVGVNRRTGTSDDITVLNLIGGRNVTTPLEVRTTGLICAPAYQL